MDLQITWLILFFCLTVQVNCDPHMSKQDVALLAAEPYPACFSRTLSDFTCFWEAPVGKSYDFLYKTDGDDAERRCDVRQQEPADGTILHACFFPQSDVFIFAFTHIRVVDKDTNTTRYNRSLSVEDQRLYYPPSNVSLQPTGKPGQILVKWPALTEMKDQAEYELRYTSGALQFTVKLKKGSRSEHTLLSLAPGQECTVQLRVKASFGTGGHWSDWSLPVTVMVPQTANDIELKCHTSDLHQVQCQWREERYGYVTLHYRQTDRNIWRNWKTCEKSNACECVLYGDERTMFQVYLTASFGLLARTFYMDEFTMNNSIKTDPPAGLKELIGENLCLSWISPLPQVSEHLKYQVRYKLQGESNWKFFTVQNSSTCLDVQANGQYIIQIKAIPNGLFYSGHWSDWSKPLTKQLSSNTGMLLIACAPFGLLIISVVLFFCLSRYISKLKQILWPPVPNMNDVLENFLKDINRQHWEPSINNKQGDDCILASLVEIISESEAQVIKNLSSRPSNCSFYPQYQLAVDSNEEQESEMSQGYILLKSSPVQDISSLTGNDYVCGLNALSDHIEQRVFSYSSLNMNPFSASTTDILNHSYIQSDARSLQTITGHYTNLETVE